MRAFALVTAFCLTACSTSEVREYLDADTAATIAVGAQGWVFARERTDLAVNARDYLTLTPVQVNRGGQRTIYLYTQLWSTIDRRREKTVVPPTATLALAADDRRVPLPANSVDIRRLGFGRPPVERESGGAEIRTVAIDVDALRYLTNASEVRIAMTFEGQTEYFLPWRDGRQALRDFLRHIEPTTTRSGGF